MDDRKIDELLILCREIRNILRGQSPAFGSSVNSMLGVGQQARCHPDLHDWDFKNQTCRTCGMSVMDRS